MPQDPMERMVQEMIDRGEDEDKIAEAIRGFPKPSGPKQTGILSGPFADERGPQAGPTKASIPQPKSMSGWKPELESPDTWSEGVLNSLSSGEARDVGLRGGAAYLKGAILDIPETLVNTVKGIGGAAKWAAMAPYRAPGENAADINAAWQGIKQIPGKVVDATMRSGSDPETFGREMGRTFGQPGVTAGMSTPAAIRGAGLGAELGGALIEAPGAVRMVGPAVGMPSWMISPARYVERNVGRGLQTVGRGMQAYGQKTPKYNPRPVPPTGGIPPSPLPPTPKIPPIPKGPIPRTNKPPMPRQTPPPIPPEASIPPPIPPEVPPTIPPPISPEIPPPTIPPPPPPPPPPPASSVIPKPGLPSIADDIVDFAPDVPAQMNQPFEQQVLRNNPNQWGESPDIFNMEPPSQLPAAQGGDLSFEFNAPEMVQPVPITPKPPRNAPFENTQYSPEYGYEPPVNFQEGVPPPTEFTPDVPTSPRPQGYGEMPEGEIQFQQGNPPSEFQPTPSKFERQVLEPTVELPREAPIEHNFEFNEARRRMAEDTARMQRENANRPFSQKEADEGARWNRIQERLRGETPKDPLPDIEVTPTKKFEQQVTGEYKGPIEGKRIKSEPTLEVLDPDTGVQINASGQSKASTEAMNRAKNYANEGTEVFEVDRAGNATPIKDVAKIADPTAGPGKTTVKRYKDGRVEVLDDKGGRVIEHKIPRASMPKEQWHTAKLSHELKGAKPRFNMGSTSYTPKFKSDLDRALFIVAQTKQSARNADYMRFIKNTTGMTEREAVEAGVKVRARIKELLKNQPEGDVDIPEIHGMEVKK